MSDRGYPRTGTTSATRPIGWTTRASMRSSLALSGAARTSSTPAPGSTGRGATVCAAARPRVHAGPSGRGAARGGRPGRGAPPVGPRAHPRGLEAHARLVDPRRAARRRADRRRRARHAAGEDGRRQVDFPLQLLGLPRLAGRRGRRPRRALGRHRAGARRAQDQLGLRDGHRRRRVVQSWDGSARTVCERCGADLGALHPPRRAAAPSSATPARRSGAPSSRHSAPA
jgi:hypothetical protein